MTQLVKYGEHPLQELKIFNYNEFNTKTLIVVHGGGWRDPRNSYNDFKDLSNYVVNDRKLGNELNIIGINYRLSPRFKHPFHVIDLLYALNYIQKHYNKNKGELSLLGHSVGATLLLQLLNYNDIIGIGIDELKAQSTDTSDVPHANELGRLYDSTKKLKITNYFFLDGIYDVKDLLSEYSSYGSFVNVAFVSDVSIEEATQISSKKIGLEKPYELVGGQFHILHSSEDELLSIRQSNGFRKYLDSKGIQYEFKYEPWGEHEQVYKSKAVADYILGELQNL
ncbi:putative kynurenine formamidase [Scheffersomyces xylosifermentans]|uniref:putative kynurenine formamidase n=1 Tax=Scheffersomyces xylosifermentans TaxID=1304137 RepID=UPI00315DD3DF